ncbi:peroxisome- protein [Apophysomyces sp. BC1034]|nr:peroxisome- protein [Apophysomyces sp. BC1015]KAG0179467.1 peroxisome- protein [Apophysomyces sp. BC1021]KAG0189887.1 peroxisome- protein [Apophysomyces sp. BC1034]
MSSGDHLETREAESTTTTHESGMHSYSSPYAIDTLDQIPTPVLKSLVGLGPVIKLAAKAADLVTWHTSQPRQSLLVVLVWISCCLWTWQVLAFGVPIFLLSKLWRDWLRVRMSRRRREKLEHERLAQRRKREEQKREDDNDEEDERRIQQQEQEELISRKIQPEGQVSLDDTLRDLMIITEHVENARQKIRWAMVYWDGSRPDLVASVLSVVLYLWPTWIVLTWVLGSSGILMLTGAIMLLSPSPWFKVAVLAAHRNVVFSNVLAALWAYGVTVTVTCRHLPSRIYGKASHTTVNRCDSAKQWFMQLIKRFRVEQSKALHALQTEEENEAQVGQRSEMVFQFEVYENQRWWLGMDWTTNMMPSERGPWTDKQLKAISSKESFHLPETTQNTTYHPIGDGSVIERRTSKTWQWADGDWWVDMTGEVQNRVDQNGWEYGNNAWKYTTGMPGIKTFTRRRRWCRRARLVERQIDNRVPDAQKENNGLRKRI